ncbi:ATP-binding protein [Microvirga sp. VF16]|uniref:ATP-binding protein n=1 Tax=Microvirga sp. VF16 TaxID=2807101 RepID=UPI00193D499C|nr:ATP-binding protein [Microvirga sp. VF16]QRM27653.1 response regulator [Microvirga sp. VF16]
MRARLRLRWLDRNSLLWRFLLIGIAALAPLSAALVQFASNERRVAVTATRERTELLASYALDRQNQVVDEARAALRFLSHSPEVRSLGAECEQFLQRYISLHHWMHSLRLSNPDGSEACSARSTASTFNPAGREFFVKALREQRFVLSDLAADQETGALQMIAAAPALDGNQTVGILSVGMTVDILGNHHPVPLGSVPETTVLVVDRKGYLIAHQPPNLDLVGTYIGDKPMIQKALESSQEAAEVPDLSGISRYFVFRPLPETDAVLAVGLNEASVVGAINETLRYRVVLITLIIGGSLLLAMLGVEWLILKPLRMLVRTAEALEYGDIGSRSPHRGVGEVRLLERALNRMAKAVTDRERDLMAARDIAEKALSQANSASMAKTNFLASMSHEIRTPLNGIIGYTEQLLGEPLNPKQRRYTDLIQVSASALLTVANDILDFSSIEADQIKLQLEPFPLVALVDNTVSIVSSGAGKEGVPIKVDLDPRIPRLLIGDEARLRQVLLNLLNNAVKFTREGHITAVARHLGSTDRGERIRIAVVDTGIGIAPEQHERLFKRFSQVDPSVRREFGGTGLGLAISKRLVELMEGEIGVESQLGKGSTFWIELVLPSTTSIPLERYEGEMPVAVAPARVLVAEDIEINQDLMKILLEGAGHRVDLVSNGDEAIAAVQARAYDLILMDIQMPGMDGITATKIIRDLDHPYSRTFIAAMTANVLPQQIRSFLEAGFDDHIGKPIRRDQLLRKLSEWLPQIRETGSTAAMQPQTDAFDERNFKDFVDMMGQDRVGLWLTRLEEQLMSSFLNDMDCEPNFRQIANNAHAITSQAALLGFSQLAELCTKLEQACLAGEDVMLLLEAVRCEARRACEKIEWLSKVVA